MCSIRPALFAKGISGRAIAADFAGSGIVEISCDGSVVPAPLGIAHMKDRPLYKAKALGRNRAEFIALEGETDDENGGLLLRSG